MRSSGAESIDRLVLDTSAYSQFRAKHEAAAHHISRADIVLVPVTVLGELEAGFRLGTRLDENKVALAEFLAEDFVEVLVVTRTVARRYGELHAGLRRAGQPVSSNDIWIAATVLDSGGRLLTFDSDFERFEALPLTLLEA
jgi:tRNA(fMet)-specific endonuclease VapC